MARGAAADVDPRSGFCRSTRTFHSLRPPVALPPESLPLSVASFTFSLLPSPLPSNPAIVDAAKGASVSFPDFISRTRALSAALRSRLGLAPGDVAFVLSPTSLDVPVLYLALLAAGVVVSPANPLSSPDEISRQVRLSKPSVAFSTSDAASKLPPGLPVVLLDSSHFRSLARSEDSPASAMDDVPVKQSDTAALLYSSGTTGPVKGVEITHRNFVALLAAIKAGKPEPVEGEAPPVSLFTIPLFHIMGFFMALVAVAFGQTMALMERFDFESMLRAVERHRVSYLPVAPPLVVAMAKSDLVGRYDLSSLRVIGSGGAPLGREVAEKFAARFPGVQITQGYGLTESGGAVSATMGPEENAVYGSAGRLAANSEAKIVDPVSGEALGPGQRGELWFRGPTVMKGYVSDLEATASTLDSEGWLKTGDLCYFNDDGHIFVVDRLKELIKYKGYQVPPAELERILQSHPAIADAAVIPYPDEDAGEIPMALLVRRTGSTISEREIMDFVAEKVSPQKKIRRVAFIGLIPKSPAGKILRRELVNHALSLPKSKL